MQKRAAIYVGVSTDKQTAEKPGTRAAPDCGATKMSRFKIQSYGT
jgi:hypothetical protein